MSLVSLVRVTDKAARTGEKHCIYCKEWKSTTDFYIRKKTGDLVAWCKNCGITRSRAYRRKIVTDPEKMKHVRALKNDAKKRYRARHPKRVQEQRRKYAKARNVRLRFLLLKKANFRCAYCGRPASETTLQIDHIKPSSKGGSNSPENLTIACEACNLGKSDILLD